MAERFRRRLESGGLATTLEITPPQKPLPEVLKRRARMLGDEALSGGGIVSRQQEKRAPALHDLDRARGSGGSRFASNLEARNSFVSRAKTRSTISSVLPSVKRRPWINFGMIPACSIAALIRLPAP